MELVEPALDDRDPSPRRTEAQEERELVRRAQLGSAAAFEQLILLRGPHLSRFLVVRLGRHAASDAFQETVSAAWQALPTLGDPAKFWPWLVGIAAHKAADARRARRHSADVRADTVTRADESMLEVREALAALPEPFAQVLLLRYYLDLSEAEVAVALGLRLGTVKSRAARARRALLEILES